MEGLKVNHDGNALASVFSPQMKGKSIRLFGCDVYLSQTEGSLKESIMNVERARDSSDSTATDQSLHRDEEDRKARNGKYYKCPFCDRLYTSSQALGGHQNAHRSERLFMKKLQHEAKMESLYLYLRSLQSSFFEHKSGGDDGGGGIAPGGDFSQLGLNHMYYHYQYDSLLVDSFGLVPY